ncbi:PIN domain-containing protein [Cellulomonas sp. URHE0023]|uniref:PIN domain-containing protein n=1 Tax=Cellulomonas sp. URHE0023 TaxID=1380354 RepID=UPI0004897955|nr:type II toxin-antitoxin system VapC family toxin [Cellulomonas sp. URHE0023]
MIALDTNVLVRYFVRDDAPQTAVADSIIENLTPRDPAFVGLLVLVELWWVLGVAYAIPTSDRRDVLTGLLDSEEIAVEDPDLVRSALRKVNHRTDFPDLLIAESAAQRGCTATVTFDKSAARYAGMRFASGVR